MKYNEELAVASLAELMREAHIVDINIGELEKSGDKYDLIVVGNDLYTSITGKRLKKISSSFKVAKKKYISNGFQKPLRTMLTDNGIDGAEADNIVKTIDKINSNKASAVMFRAGLEMIVQGAEQKSGSHVKLTRVRVNDDTGVVEMRIAIEADGKIVAEPLVEDYNKQFKIYSNSVSNALEKNKHADDIIKIENCGLIKTVEIIRDNGSYVVDNRLVIRNMEPIAKWVADRLVYVDGTKQEDKIADDIEKFLALHRKYIIPFGFCETNKIRM